MNTSSGAGDWKNPSRGDDVSWLEEHERRKKERSKGVVIGSVSRVVNKERQG